MSDQTTRFGIPNPNLASEALKAEAEVQILDRPVIVRGQDGNEYLARRFESLREGEIVTGAGGHRYKVVRNGLGYFYLRSIDGQLGAKEITIPEFLESMAKAIDVEALSQMVDFMSRYNALTQVDRADFEQRRAKASVVTEIQPLFDHLFSDKAKAALSKKIKSTLDQRDQVLDDGSSVRVIWPVMYATVNVADQALRYDAIKALAAAINDLAEKDMLGACLAPLSSLTVASFKNPLSVMSIDWAKDPNYSEAIFLFAAVKPPPGEFLLESKKTCLDVLQERYPGIFVNEGELPAAWQPAAK